MTKWGRGVLSLASLAMVSLPAVVFASGTGIPAVTNAPRLAAKPGSNGHGHGGGGGGGGSTTSFGWASSNWSGYALTSPPSGGYTSITGSWVVPPVSPSKGSTYSSTWIGIDGFNNSNLIQTGTEQDYASGGAQYYAWWEILPAAETVISNFTVKPGDVMTASIEKNSSGTWTITLKDNTSGATFTSLPLSYSGPGQSAEWIEEAPSIAGHVTTLANYGETSFDPTTPNSTSEYTPYDLTVNGSSSSLVPSDGGVMIQKHTQVSTPSLPDSSKDGFNIQYGSTVPAAPTT